MRLTREASVHQKGVGARYSEVDMGASGAAGLTLCARQSSGIRIGYAMHLQFRSM